ncbi:MAG: hypothetical protein ABH840_01405 [Nanoarchaeota archaeon]
MSEFVISLAEHPIIISLLGGIFAGEVAILALSFLAAQGYFPLWIIILFFWIGEIIADMIYFELGRSRVFGKLKNIERFSSVFEKVDNFISVISRKSVFLALLYSKFVYGIRTATVIFLGLRKTERKKFFIAECLTMVIVISILTAIGWSAGKGFSLIMNNFESIQIALTVLFIVVVILVVIREKINEFLIINKQRIKKWLGKRK